MHENACVNHTLLTLSLGPDLFVLVIRALKLDMHVTVIQNRGAKLLEHQGTFRELACSESVGVSFR